MVGNRHRVCAESKDRSVHLQLITNLTSCISSLWAMEFIQQGGVVQN